MNGELKSLLRFTVRSTAGQRAIELRMPTMLRVSGLLHEEDVARDAHRLSMWLPNLVLVFVDRIDGEPLRFDQVEPLLHDAELARGLLIRIRTLLDTLRERGKIFVLCPGCQTWETDVPITAYALAISAPIPSTFDGPFLATPMLGKRENNSSERPQSPCTTRVRFELPSAHLDLSAPIRSGVLTGVNVQPEEFEPPPALSYDDDDDETDQDDERYEPNREGPGWRALLRLSRALEPSVSIEQLEQLPAVDFFFFDLLFYLTGIAPVGSDTPGRIECPNCGTKFLPVRSSSR